MADKDDKKTRELQRRLELYKDTLRPGYKKKVETAKKAARGVDTFEKVDKDEKKKAKKKAAAKTDDAKAKRTAAAKKKSRVMAESTDPNVGKRREKTKRTDDAKAKRTAAVPKRGTDDAKAKRTAAVSKRGTDDAKAKRKISGRGSKVMDTSISDKDAMTRKKKKTKGRFGVGSNKTLNGKANVSAEQLKKTGLSLRQYMNQWNKTNKRPTAKKTEDKKVQDTIKTKDFRGPSAIGKADVAPKRKPNVDTYAKGRRETPKMEDPNFSKPKKKDPKYKHHGKKGTFFGDLSRKIGLKYDTNPDMREFEDNNASGGMIGASDMSAKKTSAPKKKKMPQYYMGGGTIKKGKPYAYGGRVAKYKE